MQAWVTAMIGVVSACVAASCSGTTRHDGVHEPRAVDRGHHDTSERSAATQRRKPAPRIAALEKYLVDIKPESAYSPVERIDQKAWYTELDTRCMQLKARANVDEASRQAVASSEQCMHKLYVEAYVPALKQRYFEADARLALELWQDAKGASDLEALFAYAHNTAILAEIRSQREPSDARSLGLKVPVSTDCKLSVDCPAGFMCDAQTGACLR